MLVALMTAGGLVGLLVGGELIVRGAVATALRLGLSPLLIGMTIVALGTSAPEVVTSVEAALAGVPDLAVGNVVGSNIANVLLVVGLCALVRPMLVANASFRRDALATFIGTLAGMAVLFLGVVERWMGTALIVLLLAYLGYAYYQERHGKESAAARQMAEEAAAEAGGKQTGLLLGLLFTVMGLALIIVSAHLLVKGAVEIARFAGLSEAIIGATIVAVGTSLPEMVTSVVAALRGQSGVALGNVMGSNLFNIMGVLGATAVTQPFPAPPTILELDIWVMLAATLALWFLAARRPVVGRLEGGLLLLCYAGYLAILLK